ncbi:type II secretion system F family protein [Planctomycetota bacterium]
MDKQELINTILMASVFVLVLSAWSICVTLWLLQYLKRRKKFQGRLGIIDAESQRSRIFQLWRDERQKVRAQQPRERQTIGERLERLRLDAGWKSPSHVVILAVIGMAGLLLGIGFLFGYDMWLSFLAAGIVIVVFGVMTKRRISTRAALFDRQLVDALGVAARALRAGHPLSGSFQLVSEEIDEPVGTIFQEICQEQSLGIDLKESLQRVARGSGNPDLKLFSTAIGIQLRTGGNLAELMDTLASVMRTRTLLHRRVRVLTAQTHLSKQILIGLPIFMFILMNFMAADYMKTLYTTWLGRMMLMVTVINILIGSWIMGKISVLRY